MEFDVFKNVDDVPWEGHFMDAGDSRIKWIYTPEKDGTPIAVMAIELQAGISLPEHRHVNQPTSRRSGNSRLDRKGTE